MGRDDDCQSVGMYSNRLKKAPPKLRFAAIHRGAMMDKAADTFPPSILATRAQRTDSGLKTERRKNHNIKDHAPQRSRLGLALSATVVEPSSAEVSINERERPMQQRAFIKERSPEENLPDRSPMVPISNTYYAQDSLKTGIGAGPQIQRQADASRSDNVKSEHSRYDPAETLEESRWKRSSPRLLSFGPDPNRQYILPKYQKIKAAPPQHDTRTPYVSREQHASEPGHAASGYPTRGQFSSEFQHYIPGETYDSFEARFNRRFDHILDPGYVQHGRKRSRHEMNAAGAETQPGSTTPPDTPPNSVKEPDLEGSKRRFQAYAASVSSTGSAAEAEFEGDKQKLKTDLDQELAAKMRGVSLNDDLLHKTRSESLYGPNTEAARICRPPN